MKWPISRRKEIAILQDLLREISTINHGSNCIQRIERCIKLTEKLNKSNLRTGRDNFVGFLVSKAHD